jgi:hypothetical protein
MKNADAVRVAGIGGVVVGFVVAAGHFGSAWILLSGRTLGVLGSGRPSNPSPVARL